MAKRAIGDVALRVVVNQEQADALKKARREIAQVRGVPLGDNYVEYGREIAGVLGRGSVSDGVMQDLVEEGRRFATVLRCFHQIEDPALKK